MPDESSLSSGFAGLNVSRSVMHCVRCTVVDTRSAFSGMLRIVKISLMLSSVKVSYACSRVP